MSYSEGKIYRIIGGDEEYIGSTIKKLSYRMSNHCSNYKLWKEGKTHKKTSSFSLFDKYGIENCKIELIELFPCTTKEELLTKEKEIMMSRICVNKISPIRTEEENKEHTKEWNKAYKKLNKEEINAKRNIKYTCQCGVILSIRNKAKHERSKKHISFISIV